MNWFLLLLRRLGMACGTGLLALSPLQLLKADTVIQDGFSSVGENRAVGSILSGTKTEQGGGVWMANSRFKFAGSAQDGWIACSAPGAGRPA
ncbi:MAG: hypothetical protein WDO13_16470 [Verrucomicrobiota bacterium]